MRPSKRRFFAPGAPPWIAWSAWIACTVLAAGCTGTLRTTAVDTQMALLRSPAPGGADDPTVRGATVFPAALEKATTWGVEPGGGVRVTMAGLRLASWADGVVRAAPGRLPAEPSGVVALPERLGGGFLFSVGTHLWRSDTWLGPVQPVFTSLFPIADVLVGLDRVYARTPTGALQALDPRTGQSRGLGPVPPSPHVARLAAIDAWREVAVADLQGAMVTLDAGSTWRPLGLPIEADAVLALGDVIAVGGPDESRQTQWWATGRDGVPVRLVEAPRRFGAPEVASRPLDAAARIFHPSPLAAAIEDGWPLVDGTALVMRDGAVARVRLADGAVVESALQAFPLDPARCHPLSLARPADPGAFGMVCGEPRGRTIVYRWDAPRSRLIELRRFETPREVLAFGNGALAARGPCSPDARDEATADATFCAMSPGGRWSELRFRGNDAQLARLVVLGDGRAVLVRPPRGGNLASASLTVVDGTRTAQHPLAIPPLGSESTEALRLGIWTDGFEERRPGVLGGWVNAAGALLGVEITLAGDVRVGELIGEGAPVASGRWALGWTASRRGFETTDGGMTWSKGIDLPEPAGPPGAVRERACGPIGCIAAGWLRVGWGSTEDASLPAPPLPDPLRAARAPPPLRLDCDSGNDRPTSPPRRAARPETSLRPFLLSLRAGAFGAFDASGTVTQFAPFCGQAPPVLRAEERGFAVDAPDADRSRGTVAVGVLEAWGPASGDWDGTGRWQMRWQWPWGGCSSSAPAPAPWTSIDAARRALGKGSGLPTWWVVVPGDDADHALFVARHTFGVPTSNVVEVETGRVPVEVRRPGGDPFPEIEGAIRIGGRWVLATAQAPSELAATVLWVIDGGEAREVARLVRAGLEVRRSIRLASRGDGRSVGVAMAGDLRTDGPPLLWMTSVDLDTGAEGEPEVLAASDLSNRTVALCTGDDAGWRLVVPYPGAIEIDLGRDSATLKSPFARMRISRNAVCIESILGSWEEYASLQAQQRPMTPRPALASGGIRHIDVGVLSSGRRFPLVCSLP